MATIRFGLFGVGFTLDDDLGRELNGFDGIDWMFGAGGHDVLHGRGGNDWLFGGSGNDQVFGEGGNDWVDGGSGDDILSGGTGHDTIDGGIGADRLLGGSGNDVLIDLRGGPNGAGNGLYGEAGNDRLTASEASDVLVGGVGRDTLTGGKGNDVLVGGDALTDARGNIIGGTLDGEVDRFSFGAGDGHDTIYGFQLGPRGDILDLTRLPGIDAIAQIRLAIRDAGDLDNNGVHESVIGLSDANGGQSLLLMNLAAESLVAAAEQHILV